ncbi:phosphoribosylformylglycinamidine cyclo-ligase [Synechococcus sp. PCC 7336]|uniref:phosphoribosylformylglycinamidine cyclo-ligase n=1 Tax=Synechococcus sp. PCC 7336 TaxID=195250 RepID=UPI000349C91B|nr:phosphoribosylformylglycinamidine cyclo-ligase [Synechococcus sp. PCC 7336]
MDYRSAGVDVARGREFVRDIQASVARTMRAGVLGGIGGFGGLFELPQGYRQPVLVSGTDGVGTKLKLAQIADRHDTIGIDLVAMCVNDILTLGAEPLFVLDYLATGKLEPQQLAAVVDGIATGCEQSGCALLGGETAEMPGFYGAGEYDVAGFCVGVVEKSQLIDGSQIAVGDRLIGLPSSGLHSNGYSLVRRIVAESGEAWDAIPAGWQRSLLETFLAPTQLYVRPILAALKAGLTVRGMAHITGGGLPENLPRCLGPHQSARIRPNSWTIPAEFEWLMQQGPVELLEMFHTFNMGIGFVLALPPEAADRALDLLPEAIAIGEVVAGEGEVLGLEDWQV